MEPIQILWTPEGATIPTLGTRPLVDVTDGDTPNIRMPIRMLSVDTPETTAGSQEGARRVDDRFVELAQWVREDRAPVTGPLAQHLLPRLATGQAGTLQWTQGQAATAFLRDTIAERLARPGLPSRTLFIRTADGPFDENHRLLAYIAPNYTERERRELSREQRSTFNLDLLATGWAAPFVIFPSIPGESDLPLLVQKTLTAQAERRGVWADDFTLLAYEYRMCERLHAITRQLVDGADLTIAQRLAWRHRYAVDLRTRRLAMAEDYHSIPPAYRLWVWPHDLRAAIAALNLIPSV